MGANDAVVNIPMTEAKSRWDAGREQGVQITTAELERPVRPSGRPNMGTPNSFGRQEDVSP
jgi:hypothetical protein